MTNKNLFNKLKSKLAIILAILSLFCLSMFVLTACDNEEDSASKPSYSYTETDDSKISNPNFTNGTASKDFDAYPIVSPSNWTKKYHNVAISSYVDSGVVDLSNEGWKELSKKLAEDKDLLKALRLQYEDKISAISSEYKSELIQKIKTDKKNNSYSPTEEEIGNYYIIDNLDDLFKPAVRYDGMKDGKVYMLNNYPQNTTYIGKGTAQTLTSSSTVTLEKGKYAKISVWVKTANITGHGDTTNHGANIRLENKINGQTQAEYRLSSIVSEGVWTQYNIYIKADADYTCTFNLSLGLGYGLGSNTACELYTQGTVFFDNITYEVLDNLNNVTISNDNTKTLNYGSELVNEIYANSDTNYLYDMSMNYPSGYFTNISSSYFGKLNADDEFFTTSNITDINGNKITSKTKVGSTSTINIDTSSEKLVANLTTASATVKLSDPANFTLEKGHYAIVSFRIQNLLSVQTSNEISIDVYDVYGSTVEKRANVISINERNEDFVLYTLLIQNNFENVSRDFYIAFNFGPSDVIPVKYANEFASGTVTISDIQIAKGIIDEDLDDENNHKYYTFLSSNPSASVPLYAGYSQDWSEIEEEVTSHILTTKPSEFSTIQIAPANVNGYEGVVADHHYIKENGTNKNVNTRSGVNGDGNGNYAGLINTKYIDKYTQIPDIKNNIGSIDEENPIQPIVIYNKNTQEAQPDSYGFISKKMTISASSFAKFSLDVRVTDNAVAYIYLVDVSKVEKEVLTFSEFTPNVTKDEIGGYSVNNANKNGGYEMALRIDKNSIPEGQDWVKVNFYIATGVTEKNIRLEVWNGSRDGNEGSKGYVFFNDIETSVSTGWTESSSWEYALYVDEASPLFSTDFDLSDTSTDQLIAYRRELTDTEKQFNNEYPEQAVSYKINYIWAKTDTMIYAVFNTIDPVENDPYASIEDEEESSGCCSSNEEVDSSTFWLTFSSIVLAVVLFFAIVVLIVRKVVAKRRANKSDAKSHYKVVSRIKSKKSSTKEDKTLKDIEEYKELLDKELDEQNDEIQEPEENVSETEISIDEQDLDSYVYGDVIENFDENLNNESKEDNNDDDNQEEKPE